MVSYCAYHRQCIFLDRSWQNLIFLLFSFHGCAFWYRTPNPDNVLIVQTPIGTFATKGLKNKKSTCSRLISSNRLKLQEAPIIEVNEVEPLSAARCRIYKRLNNKVLNIQMDWVMQLDFVRNWVVIAKTKSFLCVLFVLNLRMTETILMSKSYVKVLLTKPHH